MMKSWNVWLIFSTFLLTLLGTLLTRAGLVSSVHAFAQSSIGTWFMVFMGIVLAVCIFTYILQRNHLKSRTPPRVAGEPRVELSLQQSCAADRLLRDSVGHAVPHPQRVCRRQQGHGGRARSITAWPFPSACFCCFSPVWDRCCRGARLRYAPFAATLCCRSIALWAMVIVCFAVGVRPWKDGAFDPGNFYALVAFALSASVMAAILSEFFRGAGVISKQTGKNLAAAMYLLTRRNTRRYGGYIIHIGVVIVVIGLAGAAFNRNTERNWRCTTR